MNRNGTAPWIRLLVFQWSRSSWAHSSSGSSSTIPRGRWHRSHSWCPTRRTASSWLWWVGHLCRGIDDKSKCSEAALMITKFFSSNELHLSTGFMFYHWYPCFDPPSPWFVWKAGTQSILGFFRVRNLCPLALKTIHVQQLIPCQNMAYHQIFNISLIKTGISLKFSVRPEILADNNVLRAQLNFGDKIGNDIPKLLRSCKAAKHVSPSSLCKSISQARSWIRTYRWFSMFLQ